MTRFSATTLDLSRADRTALWAKHSFEQIKQDRVNDLRTRLLIAGIHYDVGGLETDSGVILQETSAYRELLTAQAIDDAQQKVLLAFAFGPWLDRLGDLQGCARLTDESDARYRVRIQLAPEAYASTGTPGGYIYHAASVSTDIRDVGLVVNGRGTPDVTVEISILSYSNDGVPSSELMDVIRARLYDDEIKLLTDVVVVRPAVVIKYDLAATLYMRAGPDPAVVKTQALASLQIAADRFKRLGGEVPRNGLEASLYVPGIDKVISVMPASNIVVKPHQVASLRDVTLTVLVTND